MFWDDRYAPDEYAYGTEPNDFLSSVAGRFRAGGQILCLAEGEGRNAVFLASLGLDVLAVDQSPVGLEKARKLAAAREQTIRTQVAELSSFELEPGSWDGIVSIWAHLPSAVRQSLHARCVAALKPGGLFVLEAYTPGQLGRGTGGPPEVDLLMTLEQLKRELSGLHLLQGDELVRDVSEGQYHRGTSAVVQILARKEVP